MTWDAFLRRVKNLMRERDRRWIVSLFVCLSAACDDDTMNSIGHGERRSVFDAGGAGRLTRRARPAVSTATAFPSFTAVMQADAPECREDRVVVRRCVSGQCRPPL